MQDLIKTLFMPTLFIVLGGGFLVPILMKRRESSLNASLLLAFFGSFFGALVLGAIWLGALPPIHGEIWTFSWTPSLPPLTWEFKIDRLSGFFGCLIAIFSALVAVYSFGALKAPHYHGQRHRIASAFNLFVWSTLMVVVANDVFSLIVVLEIMTLAFGYLALFKHTLYQDEKEAAHATEEKKKNARIAPQVYLIISHTSTVFLLIALLLLALMANSLSFDALRSNAVKLDPALATLIFFLALAGLGIRAGLTPAHFWVSLVHPSSPTTTHALSLGIAIKVAVYLMFRFFFQFLPTESWWGYVVLVVAVVTALINVWYAIASHDLKTALAYHSIENIGIIAVGIGVAMIFTPTKNDGAAQWIAALALVASLYHLLNHAVFKGLLYLATGAIDNQTHQVVEFNKLGGLIKIFPLTSAVFLVGAFSISGFPPFNGFVSEWLTLQSLLAGTTQLSAQFLTGCVVVLFSLVTLTSSFALTAFCFYKIAGLTLLGEPRSRDEERATWEKHDVPRTMGSVMVVLAILCLVLGVFPGVVVPLLSPVVEAIGLPALPAAPSWLGLAISPPESAAPTAVPSYSSVIPILVFVISFGIAIWLFTRGKRIKRPQTSWNCGTPYASSMQYTSGALSFLLRDLFGAAGEAAPTNLPDYLPARLDLSRSTHYPQAVIEFFRATYNRLIHWLLSRSQAVGEIIQNRDIRRYLAYIFAANIVVLIIFLLSTRGN
jgi:hydrogenase-4 component B